MYVPSQAIGKEGSSARRTLPAKSAKVISRGVFLTMTTTRPAVMRSSFFPSRTLIAGGSGDSITAQEKSLGKEPCGARRTRITPSRKTVMRSLAEPAVSSTPSLRFSTCCTSPICCQPVAAALLPLIAESSRVTPHQLARRGMLSLSPWGWWKNLRLGYARAGQHAWRVSLCCEPFLKKGRSLGAFDTAPHRVHDAALCRAIASVKSQPIRQMQLNRHALNVQFQSAQLEKALLEKHAQNFHPEKFPSDLRRQTRHEPIPCFNGEQFLLTRYLREFVEVERTMHS